MHVGGGIPCRPNLTATQLVEITVTVCLTENFRDTDRIYNIRWEIREVETESESSEHLVNMHCCSGVIALLVKLLNYSDVLVCVFCLETHDTCRKV